MSLYVWLQKDTKCSLKSVDWKTSVCEELPPNLLTVAEIFSGELIKYIYCFKCNVITHPYLNFNGGLAKEH